MGKKLEDWDLFLKWLQHFVHRTKASKNNKILLLLDGHISHKRIQVLEYAKENGIVLFWFPAHCTLRLQLLDLEMLGQFKLWLQQNPGRTVADFQISGLFKNTFLKGGTPANSVNASAKTDNIPFNPNVFEDCMFAPSLTTDQLISQEGEGNEQDLSQDHIAVKAGEALKGDSTKEDNIL